MEEQEKPPFHGLALAALNMELYLAVLSDVPHPCRSPPLMRDLKTQKEQSVLLRQSTPPVPLPQELPSTSSREKIEEHLNSNAKFKCPECYKEFDTVKAMFGHTRIHRDRSLKGFKSRSSSKLKPERQSEPDSYIDGLLSRSWSVTGKRGRKRMLDRESPEVDAALFLVSLSKGNSPNKKTEECHVLDEKKYICEICNKSFPSYQALGGHRSGHRKERENMVLQIPTMLPSVEMLESAKKKVKSESHMCEICGLSYPTGQQLGGHKRAHYKKDPSTISGVA